MLSDLKSVKSSVCDFAPQLPLRQGIMWLLTSRLKSFSHKCIFHILIHTSPHQSPAISTVCSEGKMTSSTPLDYSCFLGTLKIRSQDSAAASLHIFLLDVIFLLK